MKIQCACGAKYSFDVTPEMAAQPVQFICPGCGADSSAMVNEMIRREFGGASTPVGVLVAAAVPEIHAAQVAQVAQSAPVAEAAAPEICLKHFGQPITDYCRVCGKPICARCMEIFGYLCSPFCKSKAEAQRLDIPVYAAQRSVAEAREWRKLGRIAGSIAAVIVTVLGFWFWFTWFGQKPRAVFTVRFAEAAESGQALLAGKDQLVFVHGDTLSRYSLKTKKKIWSRRIVESGVVDAAAADILKEAREELEKASRETGRDVTLPFSAEELIKSIARAAVESVQLHVAGSNIWVATAGGLVRFDWDTGKPAQMIPQITFSDEPVRSGDELFLRTENDSGQLIVTHVNLATGKSSTEQIGGPSAAGASGGKPDLAGMLSAQGQAATAGLPLIPGAGRGKPLNPAKVAEQVQRLPYPSRVALPAVLANSQVQERTLAALDGDVDSPGFGEVRLRAHDSSSFVQGPNGFIQLSARVLEEKITTRKAMKDPPKKSVLDGNLNVTQTADVANEILNEMQRSRGGGNVEVDESRYQVTLHFPDGKTSDWTGEVIGPPSLFPLKTVNVIAAGNTLIVLDRANKKLWQSTLTHPVRNSDDDWLDSAATQGEGPCVERGKRLYVFDQAVLTAFDLATGNAQWRVPSVGTAGIFFDDDGMMYVNTTSAGLDSVKFTRQIDVTRDDGPVILKIDPEKGKILWSTRAGGFISHLSGKYIFIASWSDPEDTLMINPFNITGDAPAYVRIRRIDPDNGRWMWEHFEKRAPLDVRFEGNRILLVFSKEVEVLKFWSF